MKIKEAQEMVDQWIKSHGVRYFDEMTNLAILMEEVGELSRVMSRQFGEQSYKSTDESINLSDELADVLFVLICLANQTNIDLTNALKENLNKKTRRDGDRHHDNSKLK